MLAAGTTSDISGQALQGGDRRQAMDEFRVVEPGQKLTDLYTQISCERVPKVFTDIDEMLMAYSTKVVRTPG
jgi:hypothetical protein